MNILKVHEAFWKVQDYLYDICGEFIVSPHFHYRDKLQISIVKDLGANMVDLERGGIIFNVEEGLDGVNAVIDAICKQTEGV